MSIELRPLRFWRHWLVCWRLGADPTERAMSLDPSPPTIGKHTCWMLRQRFNPRHRAWIIYSSDKPVGRVRLTFGDVAEVHITLLPEARGKGTGTTALRRVVRMWSPVSYMARIKRGNQPSIRAFENAGFKVESITADYVRMVHP